MLPTPLFALKVVYGGELVEHLLVDGQRVAPRALEMSGYQFEFPDIDDARCARWWRHRLRRDVRRSRNRGGVTEGFRTPDLRDHNPAL